MQSLSRIAVIAAILAAPGAAGAQAISALKEHDINRPIEWDADEVVLLGREDRGLLRDNVVVRQGDLTLRADELTVFYELPDDGTDIRPYRLDATGEVTIESPSERIDAQWGVYDLTNRLITLGGGVAVTRGETRVDGERLEIDLVSGVTKLDGGSDALDGRVKGRFVLPEPDSSARDGKNGDGGK